MKSFDILMESFSGGRVQRTTFEGFVDHVSAFSAGEIIPALSQVESAVRAGFYAAGFLSYEAASGLEPSLTTKTSLDFPLLWFGIFRSCSIRERQESIDVRDEKSYLLSPWNPSLNKSDYIQSVERIREYIASGDTYQVNYTFRLKSSFSGNARELYHDLCQAQRARYCAFLDIGRYRILSASPELFFFLENRNLTVRPMKGTATRGRWLAEDLESASRLKASEKECAENLMIVDLLRNDIGRISETGSVTVESLFDLETIETVHQMTSTICSRLRTNVGLVDLLRALFPCGSVTGAPKKRSMEIITELEKLPRGLYTGCIGYISPGMEQAFFNVAIRTVVIHSETGVAELGVGSGITWDSQPETEFDECLAKGLFASGAPLCHELLESILYEEGDGFFLFERHLERLSESGSYFGFTMDILAIRDGLIRYAEKLSCSMKVRLSVSRNGAFTIQAEEILKGSEPVLPLIALAVTRVESSNPFLYHKTNSREVYVREQAARPDCVDVVFLNERDEITEAANNNIVIRKEGKLVTPTLESGLLPGTFRGYLLERGAICEQMITLEDLALAEEVYLINSVRKWRRVKFEKGGFH
jgi:para-aminobenzoate synthetase/4-amino-4-deoxychorismate lyase